MSFLFRAPSQSRGARPDGRGPKSFSVRTGKMEDTFGAQVSAEPPRPEPSKEFLAARHFLRSEVQAAHGAVSVLDQYIHKLKSFEEKAMELMEEAHRALSRVEQAVATAAAPELIVVACEIKVACHRGLHLFKTYGRYRYLGKLIALATRSSITAKFDAVIARLTGIMPLDRLAVSSESGPAGSGNGGRALAGSPTPNVAATHPKARSDSPAPSDSACSTPRIAAASSPDAKTASSAAEVLSNMMKANSSGNNTQFSSTAPAAAGAAADVAAIMVRAGAHDKITALSFVQPLESLSAAACVWWAEGDKLEFFSSVTQSTTSFAAPHTQALGSITAVTLDSAGNVWAGTSRGSVIMRQRKNWEQTLVDRAFSSRVRCLAADADSDVVWAGDECGRLAVLRYNGVTDKVECTAIILPGRRNGVMSLGGLKGRTAATITDGVKSKSRSLLQMRHTTSGRYYSPKAAAPPEGPIRTMMVRDDRAWVAGGRAEPWLAIFDAVQGTQLDVWMCSSYGSCTAMASLLTTAALAEQAATLAAAARSSSTATGSPPGHSLAAAASNGSIAGSLIASTLPEDGIGEDPRSSWRLITGHDNGQLLIWEAACDTLHPLVKVGEAGASPIRAVAALEQQGLLAVAHATGELVLFNRPAKDEDWMLASATAHQPGICTPGTMVAKHAPWVADSTGSSRRPSGSSGALVPLAHAAAASATISAAAVALRNSTLQSPLTTIKPRKAVLRTHRCSLAAAAACSYGVVTASSLGAIKLWTAEALAREAEKLGMPINKPQLVSAPSEAGSLTRSSFGGGTPSRLASAAGGDYSARGATRSPAEQSRRTTAEDYLQRPQRRSHSPKPSFVQQDLQSQQSPAAHTAQLNAVDSLQQQSWWGQHVKQRSPPWPSQQQPYGQRTSEHRCSPGSTSASQGPDQSQPTSSSSAAHDSAMQDMSQHVDLAKRSAPVSIPGQQLAGQQADPSLQDSPGALLQQSPHTQLMVGSCESAAGLAVGTPGMDSAPGSFGYGSYNGSPDLGSDAAGMMLRDRRKSERRLSRGAQMRWSSCQMVASSELKLLSQIGNGAYGKVWLAEWMSTQVAVKELVWFQDRDKERGPDRTESLTNALAAAEQSDSDDSVEEEVQRELKELMDEVFLLGSLTHPCISRFCALCLDPPMIVMQYYPHGSLYELLKRGKKGDRRALQELTWPKRLEMLRDVASGMVFLHSRRPPVVHGDLRSPNLLLDYTVDRDRGRYHVKIADFGLARVLGAAGSIPVSKVTNPRWSAPEVIRSSTLSRSADVFSFAVVMWELLTWQQPYEDMMSVQVLFNVVQQARPEVPPYSELPGLPGSQLPRYITLMEACWQEDPADRPCFEDIVRSLDEMRAVDCAKSARAGPGSRRLSYLSEAGTPTCGTPINCGTPTGSGFFADSPLSSCMGSTASSAGNSAGPAAAALAAAAAPAPQLGAGVGSEASSRSSSPQPTSAAGQHSGMAADSYASQPDPAQSLTALTAGASISAAGPSGTISAWRIAAQSDPGTPPATAAGDSSSKDRRLQLAGVGSTPTGSGSGSERAQQQQQQQQQQQKAGSPGGTLRSGSPGTVSGNSSPGSFGGYAEPSFAMQLNAAASPAAGGSSPVPSKTMQPPVTRTPSRLGPIRTSGILAAAGNRDGPAAATTTAGPAAGVATTGVLQMLGLPLLDAGATGEATAVPRPASPFSMAADPSPPVSPHHKGMSAYSPFAVAAGPPSDLYGVDAEMAAALGTAVGGPRLDSPVQRPVSPFSAVQSEADDEPLFGQISPAISRPASPFANMPADQACIQQQQPVSSWQVGPVHAANGQQYVIQQQRVGLPRVSPFSSVSVAAVEGPAVSELLMEARALHSPQAGNTAV